VKTALAVGWRHTLDKNRTATKPGLPSMFAGTPPLSLPMHGTVTDQFKGSNDCGFPGLADKLLANREARGSVATMVPFIHGLVHETATK